MINQLFHGWGHKWVYDLEELKHVAQLAGFNPKQVTECHFHQGRIAEMAGLDMPVRNDESIYTEIAL